MAIDENKLSLMKEDATRVFGRPVEHFLCPILLKDELGSLGLMNGHILPQAVKKASRRTIIQRGDVDSYFGAKLETHLINLVNAPDYTWREFCQRSQIKAVSPDERKLEARDFAGGSNPPFAQFQIPNPGNDGGVIANVFVKENFPGPVPKMDFEFTIMASDSLLVGAFLKAAHLTMFYMFGYSWINSCPGDLIRRKLADFVIHEADHTTAPKYFNEFRNCFKFIKTTGFEGDEDTLTTNRVIIHCASAEVPGDVFGISCIFKLNDMTSAVMIPYCSGPEHLNFGHALSRYKSQLAYPDTSQTIHVADVTKNGLEILPVAMRIGKPGE